jgi:hypothetical protein
MQNKIAYTMKRFCQNCCMMGLYSHNMSQRDIYEKRTNVAFETAIRVYETNSGLH